MELLKARMLADTIIKELLPFCHRIEIVGSIRRKKKEVDDIDILLAPKTQLLFDLMEKITRISGGVCDSRISNRKTFILKNAKVELWFTTTEAWPVMLLIRTGGAESNHYIAKVCERKDWHLSVSKGAIFNEEWKRVPIKKEEDIFEQLDIPYLKPEERQ